MRVGVLMPTFNDWLSVAHLLPALDAALASIGARGHIFIVEDGSNDLAGRELIDGLALTSIDAVSEITLVSNQGNQRALAIGLGYVAAHHSFDYLAVMDSDHEDRPADIPSLLDECRTSGRIVFAERALRHDTVRFKLFYAFYKFLFRLATGTQISMGNFCLIPGRLIGQVANLPELFTHFPSAIMRSRIPYTKLRIDRGRRLFGSSSMSLVPLVAHGVSAFTIYSDVIGVRGLIASALACVIFLAATVLTVILRFTTDIVAFGSAKIIVALIVLMMMQAIGFSLMILFFVNGFRSRQPLIPYRDHGAFIAGTECLWPK
jgi:hypothetical protein